MSEPHGDDRRQYRVEHGTGHPVSAEVLAGAGPVAARVVDTSATGIALVLEAGAGEPLAVGSEVTLRLSCDDSSVVVTTRAELRRTAEVDRGVRHGLRFSRLGELYGQLDPPWWRHFNRRRHVRRALEGEVADLVLAVRGRVVRTRPTDLSEAGLGCPVGVEDGRALVRADRVRASFRLPGGAVSLPAAVRHVTPRGDAFYLGLELAPDADGGAEEGLARVASFLHGE